MNPMPDGTYTADRPRPAVGRAQRRRAQDVLPDGRGVRRLLGVHRRPGRPDRRLPRGVRPAREHADLLLRRQRRLGRGQPERLRQRGQDLRRLSRRPRAEPDDGRQARVAGHLQPLPDRLGDGVLHAVPDVQALHLPGRGLRPAGHPLAPGIEAGARCATSTTTAPTSCPRSSRPAGSTIPDVFDGARADSAVGRLDGLLVRRRATPRPPSETQYYEMLGNRGIWHQGWKAVAEHGPMAGTSKFAEDTWQLFHTDEDRAEAHDVSAEHPERCRSSRPVDEEAKANNVLPLNDLQIIGTRRTSRPSSRWSSTSRCRRAASTRTTRARRRSRSDPLPTCTTSPTRCSPRWS